MADSLPDDLSVQSVKDSIFSKMKECSTIEVFDKYLIQFVSDFNKSILNTFCEENNLSEWFKKEVLSIGFKKVQTSKREDLKSFEKYKNEVYSTIFNTSGEKNFFHRYKIDFYISKIRDWEAKDYYTCLLLDEVEGLIVNIVKSCGSWYDEDLISAWKIWVFRAIESYDPTKATFTSYCYNVIKLEVQREQTKLWGDLNVPNYYNQVNTLYKKFCQERNEWIELEGVDKIDDAYEYVTKIVKSITKKNFIQIIQYFQNPSMSITSSNNEDGDSIDILWLNGVFTDPYEEVKSRIDYEILVDDIKKQMADKSTVEKIILQRKFGIFFDKVEFNQFTVLVERNWEIKDKEVIAYNVKWAIARCENLWYTVLSTVKEIKNSKVVLELEGADMNSSIFQEMLEVKWITDLGYKSIIYHEKKLTNELRRYIGDLSYRTNSSMFHFDLRDAFTA